MIKLTMKVLGILLLLLVAFLFGANQHRARAWPFGDHGLFSGDKPSLNKDKGRGREIALLIENLKKGGYILYFRHAQREKWPEAQGFDFYEFASQTEDASETSFRRAVCLSDQGIEEAKLIGKTFQLAKIPTGIVITSPSCRAKQTAVYAFGKYDVVDESIRFAGPLADQLSALLSNVEIKAGTNTIISGHNINLGRNGVGLIDAGTSGGNSPPLLETGFYVIERRSDGKLALVFTFKSISELTTHAINISRK